MDTGPEPGAADAEELLAADPYPDALRAPFAAYNDFLPWDEAEALRAPIDLHFSAPHQHSYDVHFVWNYWYVPGLYTYLRAQPEKVIPRALVESFHAALTRWAGETLGLANVSWPILSLYVDGCGQGIHNDSANGRFGYVYSLTKDRHGRGGETIVFKEGDPFRTRMNKADAGTGLYDLVAPIFNRLVLFDDRMPHGVQRVEGTMDPTDARIVLHGHINEAGPIMEGPLPARFIEAARDAALNAALAAFPDAGPLHHGPLCVRLEIAPHGRVSDCRVLVHRVARSDGGSPDDLVEEIIAGLFAARFPPTAGPTVATLPILTGSPLPLAAGLRDS
jgi:Rps23 Pro-64 3,4-dihydroxylase Tpa1-like proline 4-hydroxylase